jgi:hypothetical protein
MMSIRPFLLAALAFLGRPRTEHVHRAAGREHHSLCLEDVDLVLTDAEARGRCNAVRLFGIVVELHDEHALIVVLLHAGSGTVRL